MVKKILIFIFLFYSAAADEIRLKNSSLIIGDIEKVHKGKIYINTEFAGKLVIDRTKVEYFKTDNSVTYRRADIEAVNSGIYDSRELPKVTTLWEGRDPDQFFSFWARKIWLDFVRRTGNSNSSSFAAGFDVALNREFETVKLYGKYTRNKQQDVYTADERVAGIDFEKRFKDYKRHSYYLRAEYEKDRVEGVDLRSTYGAGYGYYAVKSDSTKLRLRSGLLYRQEKYIDGDSQNSLAVDLGLLFNYKIYEDIEWYTDITYSPAFDSLKNFRMRHESGIKLPLKSEFNLSLNTGVEHTYNSQPSEGRESLDKKYFMRLEIEF